MLHKQVLISLKGKSVTIDVCYENGSKLASIFEGSSLTRNLIDYIDWAKRLISDVVHKPFFHLMEKNIVEN